MKVSLESLCTLLTDGTHYTPPNIGEGFPFLTVVDMQPSGLNFETCSRISPAEFAEADRQNSAPKSGDVLFSKDGTVGKVHVVNGEGPFAVLSSIAIIRPDSEKLDPGYLAHFLRSPEAVSAADRSKTGSALRRIILKDIKRLSLNPPPLPEQRRIAGILDQADALRRIRRQSLSRLSALGQAIFYEMFGDPILNPIGWDQVRLGDLCEVGSSKRVFASEFLEDGVPFYRGTEVGKLGSGETIQPTLFIGQAHYESLVQHSGKPTVGDILLPSICHDGRIWTVDSEAPFYFKDGRVLWIKCSNSPINGDYLRSQLRNLLLHNYNAIASGSNFAELKIVNLKNLKLLTPPLSLQRRFAQSMKVVGETRHGYETAVADADSLFFSLQHRAFRGEL